MLAIDNLFAFAGTEKRTPVLTIIKPARGKGRSMKITVATVSAISAILFVSGFSPSARAQAQIGVPGIGQVTIGQPPPPPPSPEYGQARPSEYAQHCEHLRQREHELREQVAYMPYVRNAKDSSTGSGECRKNRIGAGGAESN